MKSILKILIASLALTAFSQSVSAQKVKTISFTVAGVCDMCKDRIEGALDIKGVKMATYDLDTHTLTVTYKTSKITEEQLHQLIAAVGHDTDKVKATDEAYEKVHGCCKYRSHEHNH